MASASSLALGISATCLYIFWWGPFSNFYSDWSGPVALAATVVSLVWWARDVVAALKAYRTAELWTTDRRRAAVAIEISYGRMSVASTKRGVQLDLAFFKPKVVNATPWAVTAFVASFDLSYTRSRTEPIASGLAFPAAFIWSAAGGTIAENDEFPVSIRELSDDLVACGLIATCPVLSALIILRGKLVWSDGIEVEFRCPVETHVYLTQEQEQS